jgi:hypothetical protein
MSISRKIYNKFLELKEFVSRKSFHNTLVVFLSMILFFGVMNVYAQEDVKLTPDWDGTKEFHNQISGTEPDEDNMNSRQGLEILNTAWTALSIVAPEVTENGDDVMNNSNIPSDLRKGLIGMAEDAGTLAYASYPAVDIPSHLAQQWVPGYDEKVTGLYAQNSSSGHISGYEELVGSGVVSLWNRVLNLSYVAFVIVMIVAGFMIMFRHKLGGQTMVTIGNVLPGVITALILATFSFAIAGLIIDLGGIISGLVAFILGDGTEISSISDIGKLMGSVLSGGVATTSIITGVVGALGITGYFALGSAVLGPVGLAITGVVGVLGIIIALLIVGIILVGAVKVLITLYKALFSLLLNVVLGPIQITLGALPGNRHMINNWFLSIVRNVLVFPVVLFIVNLPNALVASNSEVLLRFPGKLVYEDPNTYDPSGGLNVAGGLFIFILKIFVLYFAAQAPKYLEAVFPPNTSKAMIEGLEGAKKNLSGIPLIGGLFK